MVEELFIKNTQKSVFRSSSNYTLEWRNNQYGEGEPQFHITFHKPLSKKKSLRILLLHSVKHI